MKIAIVVNGFPENSETFIINKVLALANAGNNVHVIRLNRTGNQSLFKLYEFGKNERIKIENPYLPTSLVSFLSFIVKNPIIALQSISLNSKQFYNNIRKKVYLGLFNNTGFDIIHFEFSGLAVSFLDFLNEIKPVTVLSCRGSAEKVKILTEPNRAEKLAKAFDIIHAIHCVSSDMQNTIQPYCKEIEKIFVNRPAIDASFFTPNKQTSGFDGISILSIGRFSFQKGYLIGILAIKLLVDKGYNIRWNIIGDGPLLEEIMFHIHALHLENTIILHGKKNKNEVNAWINKSDIFLLTSVYEGIPNVVLEAMAMELPVVTTRSGGVDEVIDHGADGFIAELYNMNEIANFLEQLITNKELAIKMGKEARKKILADYTIQRQLDVFQKNYSKLLERK